MRGLVPDSFPVYVAEDGSKKVLGRELYKFLGLKKGYMTWMKQMISYGFSDKVDYEEIHVVRSDGRAGKQKKDHILSQDMALHIAMIQRTEAGKKIRQKLIDLEKQ